MENMALTNGLVHFHQRRGRSLMRRGSLRLQR